MTIPWTEEEKKNLSAFSQFLTFSVNSNEIDQVPLPLTHTVSVLSETTWLWTY